MRYVDRLNVDELRRQYSELAHYRLVPVDMIDDGERLSSVPDNTEDFLIANHLIEHTENPMGAIANWIRVLKPGGVLYVAVPHRDQTFDRYRPITSIQHVIEDYKQGPERSRRRHFDEWVRLVTKTPEHRIDEEVERLMAIRYSIHFHVWTELPFLEMLLYLRNNLKLPFSLELVERSHMEFIVILRKSEVS